MKPFLAAAHGKSPSRTPVWFMRQAGRYLPEYREIRKNCSFVELAQNPELAAEVTLQPLRRFDLDAAIIFSDILFVPTALGQNLTFAKNHGPILDPAIDEAEDVAKLKDPENIESLMFVGEALAKTKLGLNPNQTLIGFAGAPLTVASYMIEGSGSKQFMKLRKFIYQHPQAFKDLLEKIAINTALYVKMQIEAGAEAIMLFDSWANCLPTKLYQQYIVPNVETIAKQVRATKTPFLYYPGQDLSRLTCLQELTADVISIDWRLNLSDAIKTLKNNGQDVCVQGNIDPAVLFAPKEEIKQATIDCLENGKNAKQHIFNVGHGLNLKTPIESIQTVVETIRNHS